MPGMRTILLALLLLVPAVASADEGPSQEALDWAREVVRKQLENAPQAPEFPDDREWLNVARPLTLKKDLAGKVVILDFWCYCCINCIHVLPDLEYLEKKYAGKPVAVIGVHSAKFTNEKQAENIREAIRRYEIHHPVVNDDDFRIWRSYGARSWPTFAVITPDGRILGRLSGEGNREDLDALVTATLEHFEAKKPKLLNAKPLPMRLERASRPSGQLAYPGKVAVDAKRKSLFIADSNHNRIVETALDGTFKRAFGSGERGLEDGPADKARFFRPQGMAVDGDVLWVADTENHAIRRIDLATGAVTTAAGTGKHGNLYVLLAKDKDATSFPGPETALNSPWDVLRVGQTLFIAMAGSHQLWTLDPKTGRVARFAGDGSERRLDHTSLTQAAFAQPSGLTFDGTHLYVADSESSAVVRVGLKDGVRTLAGASAKPKDLFHYGDEDGAGFGRRFQHCLDVLFHDGVLYVADSYNDKIKSVDRETGHVTTRWGDGREGASDEPPRFSEPAGLAALGTTLYVADTNNHAIRAIDLESGTVTTLPLKGVPIPQVHTRGRDPGGEWPTLPGTAFLSRGALRVSSAGEPTIELKLELPIGWKLTEGAPSALRLEIGETITNAAILSLDTPFRIPVLAEGQYEGRLRLLYYVCQDDGGCHVRSVEMPLSIEAAQGAGTPVLRDLFKP